MARCDACEQLVGAKGSVEPHADLQLLEQKSYKSDGFRNAHFERYRCKVCATPWLRDTDARDSGARWDIDKV
jgi:hypothetical protein